MCRRANFGSRRTARRGLWRRQLPHSKKPLSSSCRRCRAKALRGQRRQVGGSRVSCGRLTCKAPEHCWHMLLHRPSAAPFANSPTAASIKQRSRFDVRAVMRPDVAKRACGVLSLQCPFALARVAHHLYRTAEHCAAECGWSCKQDFRAAWDRVGPDLHVARPCIALQSLSVGA